MDLFGILLGALVSLTSPAHAARGALAAFGPASAASVSHDASNNLYNLPAESLAGFLGLRHRKYRETATFEGMADRAHEVVLRILATVPGENNEVMTSSVVVCMVLVLVLTCACVIVTYVDEEEGRPIKSGAGTPPQDEAWPWRGSWNLGSDVPTPQLAVHSNVSRGPMAASQHPVGARWTGGHAGPSMASAAHDASRPGTTRLTRTDALLSRVEARLDTKDSLPTAPTSARTSASSTGSPPSTPSFKFLFALE